MSVNIINILYLRQYANKKVKIVRFWPVKMIMCFIISIFHFMLWWFFTLHHAHSIEGHRGAVLANHMFRLNSGIKNRHNFFVWAIFLFEKLGTDSVNYADSRDIKILIWFPGKSILKFAIIFWKCVGGAQMCGWNILKIAQCVNLITPVIFICKIRGTYLILPKPTQFQPT